MLCRLMKLNALKNCQGSSDAPTREAEVEVPVFGMYNASFQDDFAIEMENVKPEGGKVSDVGGGKEEIAINLENQSYSKGDAHATDAKQLVKTEENLKQYAGACEPQLCRETNKTYLKIAQDNKSFDPMIKMKAALFFGICFMLLVWSIIHFSAINSP